MTPAKAGSFLTDSEVLQDWSRRSNKPYLNGIEPKRDRGLLCEATLHSCRAILCHNHCMRIYIIRHADPDYPNNTITPKGHIEAEALAVRMERIGLDRIYTSPMGRARDTAAYTAKRLGIEPEVEDWTAELHWIQKTPKLNRSGATWDYSGEDFRSGTEHPTPHTWHTLPPVHDDDLGERWMQLEENSNAFLAKHGFVREGRMYRSLRQNTEKIAVFCHGGFGLTWLAHLLEIPVSTMWSGFWLPPTSVSMVLMEQQSAEWAVPRCVGLGDTSHLYEAGLPIQPRGVYALNW